MKLWKVLVTVVLGTAFAVEASAQTTLRIFTGGQQRPDVMRKIADEYTKRNPNVKIDVEVGGATSEAQQQYLNTVLASKDSALDLMLIDVIRPAQWAAAGWAEPLDSYLGADKVANTLIKAINGDDLPAIQASFDAPMQQALQPDKASPFFRGLQIPLHPHVPAL